MKRRELVRRARSTALRILVPLLTQTVGRLPYWGLALFARGLARMLMVTNRRHRVLAKKHLKMAFPEASESEIATLVRKCFLNAALNAVETLHLLARGYEAFDQRLVVEGAENLERERGKRLLVLSCHSGFWEILGIAGARYGMPFFGIGRRPDDPAVADIVSRVRTAVRGLNIERGTVEGRSRLRQALRGDGGLVMLIDQDTKVDGTWVPFFGRMAYTPVGAAEMALKHKMQVVPTFSERREGGRHVVRFLPALDLPDDVTAATAVMTAAIEEQIRRNPAQWVWWHRRWRRQPESAVKSSQNP